MWGVVSSILTPPISDDPWDAEFNSLFHTFPQAVYQRYHLHNRLCLYRAIFVKLLVVGLRQGEQDKIQERPLYSHVLIHQSETCMRLGGRPAV